MDNKFAIIQFIFTHNNNNNNLITIVKISNNNKFGEFSRGYF